jgi:hypothetical protein
MREACVERAEIRRLSSERSKQLNSKEYGIPGTVALIKMAFQDLSPCSPNVSMWMASMTGSHLRSSMDKAILMIRKCSIAEGLSAKTLDY